MKKKILMVHNFYQIGGGEHTVYNNEVNLLRENGYEVIEYTRSNDELKTSKLKMLLLPFTTVWSCKTYREVKKIIKKEKIEVVHCHNTFPLISPSVYYAARKCKIPVVQTIHNFRFLCPCGVFFRDGHICEECLKKNSLKPAIKHKCYRNSRLQTFIVTIMLKIHRKLKTYKKINYIFLTEFNKQKFSKLIDINGDNVFVKPNFVNQVTCSNDNAIENKFIFVGRLEENKGIKDLIEKWKLTNQKYELHIYGDGSLKEYVEEECRNNDNLIFYGFKSQKEILDDMKNSIALIFPSLLYEGFPMIILESMSIGCPIISTCIGNGSDLVNKSNAGLIYNPESIDDFNNIIEQIVKNNKTYRQNAIDYYNYEFSDEKKLGDIERIYNNLSGGGDS